MGILMVRNRHPLMSFQRLMSFPPKPPEECEAPVLEERREEGCDHGQERIHPRPAARAVAVDRVVVPFDHDTGLH
jgi:hypothetical protein